MIDVLYFAWLRERVVLNRGPDRNECGDRHEWSQSCARDGLNSRYLESSAVRVAVDQELVGQAPARGCVLPTGRRLGRRMARQSAI
jgi:hypothetical protein